MRVTVAICTWNRPVLLDRTLDRLGEVTVPAGIDWEVVVVHTDADSSSPTNEVLARHCGRLPLRGVCAPERGLSRQRNVAVQAAEGDLILWTDDDVLVEPDWLSEHVAAALRWPEAAFFGGAVIPWFETPPPAWVTANWTFVSHVYAAREFQGTEVEVGPQSMPYGANYAIRAEVQRRYLYNPNLGRNGENLIQGEEFSLIRQMLADGHRGRIIPTARVRHFIPSQRLTLDYVRRWFFALGQCHEVQTAAKWPACEPARRAVVKPCFGLCLAFMHISDWIVRRLAGREDCIWPATQVSYFRGRLARTATPGT